MKYFILIITLLLVSCEKEDDLRFIDRGYSFSSTPNPTDINIVINIDGDTVYRSDSSNLEPECISGERIINGDFEEDIINKNWDLLTELTGWEFKWTKASACDSQDKNNAYVEIQRFASNQLPNSEQYVELDTDCIDKNTKRQTNIKLYQDIDAYVGEKLLFSFNYKARRVDRKNKMKVRFGKRNFQFKNKDFKDTDWKYFEKVLEVRQSDVKNGKLRVSFKDQGKADTYGIFIDNVSVKSIDCPVHIPCTNASEVISYSPAGNIAGDRQDPSKSLGEADGEPFNGTINFVSLGFGGEIVLKLDNPVKNVSGSDLKIWEVTGGNNSYEQYKEEADVYGSIDGQSWTYLGRVKNDNGDASLGEVDLGSMDEALYIKIVDMSPIVSNRDGFDVDAISCLNQ